MGEKSCAMECRFTRGTLVNNLRSMAVNVKWMVLVIISDHVDLTIISTTESFGTVQLEQDIRRLRPTSTIPARLLKTTGVVAEP
jgi:hypothetical protein